MGTFFEEHLQFGLKDKDKDRSAEKESPSSRSNNSNPYINENLNFSEKDLDNQNKIAIQGAEPTKVKAKNIGLTILEHFPKKRNQSKD